jgi:membrane protease YdiL (CAAX protease family)
MWLDWCTRITAVGLGIVVMANELSYSLMAISAISATVIMSHKVGSYPSPVSRSDHPCRIIADALLVWGIYMVVILMFVKEPSPVAALAIQDIISFVPVLLLPILYVRHRDKWKAIDFGLTKNVLGRQTWVVGIAFGVLWSLLAAPLVSPLSLANPSIVAFLILKLYSPAFLEEVLARGIVQGKMERALGGHVKPILLTSVLFMLWHVPKFFLGGTGNLASIDVLVALLDLAGVYLGGVLLGILYRKTRSLLPGIIVHYLYDFGPSIFSWII